MTKMEVHRYNSDSDFFEYNVVLIVGSSYLFGTIVKPFKVFLLKCDKLLLFVLFNTFVFSDTFVDTKMCVSMCI